MKNLILILSIFFIFNSCNESDENKPVENSIYGTWRLIEKYDGGSPTPVQKIENGEVLVFTLDNIFKKEEYPCDGTFSLTDSIMTWEIPCLDNMLPIKFYYGLSQNKLTIGASIPSTCDEGCYNKYIKID